MNQKILLLEDDITLNETVLEYLSDLHYDVTPCFDGEEAYVKAYEQNFDLLLLDVNVPLLNGFTLLKNLREQDIKTPAIFITSLNSIDSFEEGFDVGCDDYIRKPFELKELSLRVKTILKRGYFHEQEDKIVLSENKYYDVNTNSLFVNNEQFPLNKKESKLLKYFLKNQNIILSHEMIYENVWDYDEQSSDYSLRTYIKNIRKALGKESITSVKRLGYRFNS